MKGGPGGGKGLPAGTYRIHAVLAGKPVTREETNSDVPGLALLKFWTGTCRSAEVEFTLTEASRR